jgi:hypothetical protein
MTARSVDSICNTYSSSAQIDCWKHSAHHVFYNPIFDIHQTILCGHNVLVSHPHILAADDLLGRLFSLTSVYREQPNRLRPWQPW